MKERESINSEAFAFFLELRSRLLYSIIFFFILFAVFLYFSNNLYTLLAKPLLKFLPQGHLIATKVVSPLFVPFKLAFIASVFLTMPFFLYQLWGFVAPALYGHERRMLYPFVSLSTFLFYAGILFCYFIIFPLLFDFLAHIAPTSVMLAPDISEYLDFTIKLLIVFGVLFQIPTVMWLLVSLGLVKRQKLIKLRSYAIVGAFIMGMLLAPPDVFSQTVLALPIWFLYEIGIGLTRFIKEKEEKEEKEE